MSRCLWIWMLLNVNSSLTLVSLPARTSLSMRSLIFSNSASMLPLSHFVVRSSFWHCHGVPVSVTIANLVMEDVEECAPLSLIHPYPFRNAMSTTTALLSLMIELMNWRIIWVELRRVHFTVELECDGKLPFLDLLLPHESDGSITTAIYRKSTHTDKYIDFESHILSLTSSQLWALSW